LISSKFPTRSNFQETKRINAQEIPDVSAIKDNKQPGEGENNDNWMKEFLKTSQNLVFLAGNDGRILYANRAGDSLLGEWKLRVGDKLPPEIKHVARISISRGSKEEFEIRSGERVFLLVFHPSPEKGRVSICGFDITEQKRTEEELRKSEEKYRYVAEQTGQFILDYDVKTKTVEWAGAIEELMGYSAEEFRKFDLHTFAEHIHPEDLKIVLEAYARCRQTGEKYHGEFRVRRKDGSYFHVEGTGICLKNESDCVCRVLGMVKDVTERKLAREKLEKSEERFRLIVEQTGQGIYDYDVLADRLNWEGAMEEITGYACKDPCLSSKKLWLSHLHPEDHKRVAEYFEEALKKGGKYHQEYRIERKAGTYAHVEVNGVFLKDKKGRIYRLLGIIKDVTERKLSEEAIRKSEEISKKEIHHRIKNNLQVISSLLDLQTDFFKDEKVIEAFRESQNRVISMALIHEELYRSEDVESLDFSAYLRKLTTDLFESYKVGSSKIRLRVEAEARIHLCMDAAIPLGIIVNELVSNSLKYAFPGGEGEIRIQLYSVENTSIRSGSGSEDSSISSGSENSSITGGSTGKASIGAEGDLKNSPCRENFRCMLIVSDNGSGFPKNIDFENPETLGLQLVKTLVEQIDGEIELRTNGGTEFRIGFGSKETGEKGA
jgi:PAS domain S-box-containing protein